VLSPIRWREFDILLETTSSARDLSSERKTTGWDDVCLALRAEDEPSPDRIVSELVQLGLSKDQARVYASGARLGKANARKIAKECALDLSTTYARLKELSAVGLVEIELGTPNLYVARCPDTFLEKCKSELIEREQVVDQIASEISHIQSIQRTESELSQREPSYRIFLNRTQHFNSSLRYWKGARNEVLIITPSRMVSRIVNDRLDVLRESHEKGVKWRWLTDIKESNLNDVDVIAKFSKVRHCPNLTMSMTIFDRSVVFFCANPTFVTTVSNSNEAHFTFEDPAVADAFSLFFESLWKVSVDVMTKSSMVEKKQIPP